LVTGKPSAFSLSQEKVTFLKGKQACEAGKPSAYCKEEMYPWGSDYGDCLQLAERV